jgi:hypothetical protein
MKRSAIALALLLGTLAARPAQAILHLWDIAEIYSNADGSVQFIELFTTGDFEVGWSVATIKSVSNDLTISFTQNLPGPTPNHWVLLATPGFAALPGGVAPDFEIPAGFFDTSGDTLVFGFNIDTVTFAPGQLPLDGVQALHRTLTIPSPEPPQVVGPEALFVGTNSPTNFAGQTGGLVPEPATLTLVAMGLAAFTRVRRRR